MTQSVINGAVYSLRFLLGTTLLFVESWRHDESVNVFGDHSIVRKQGLENTV